MHMQKIEKTLKSYPFVEFALLFGSYVRDAQTELSDIDIAIYVSYPISLLEQGELISLLEESLEKKVDLVILNNLYRDNAKMAFNIVDQHLPIYSKNNKKYIEFKANTYTYYFDLKPMYEMFDKALIERMNRGTYGKTKAS